MNSSSRKPPTTDFDALVIGAGHNGLVCACYLAKAGLRVGVFERRSIVGGAAVTEEFAPGFRNSTASYTVSLLEPKVIRELRLAEHGLRILERPMQNFLPLPDGDSFSAGPDSAATLEEIRRYSTRDAARLPDFHALLGRAVDLLRGLLQRTPPTDLRRVRDLWEVLRFGREFRAMPLASQRELHEFFTRSAGEILDHWFESEPLKALFGFDSVVGSYASPYTPGSAYVLLHHAFGEVNGKPGVWGHAVGGMGAITQAIAKECAARGVEVLTDAAVAQVTVADGRASGAVLADGRAFTARVVAANLHPKTLFTRLVPATALDDDFRARIGRHRNGSATFRMNVALSELPDFRAAPGATQQPHHQSGILVGHSLRYFERAYFDARSKEHNAGWAREPIVELVISSTLDDTLASAGQHVASLFCQHVDPQVDAGWDAHRDTVANLMIDTVDRVAPNFRRSVLGFRALSPLDLEREFGLVGGDIFHGSLGLDQMFSARPLLGAANYRTPVRGLYLCGAGAHPGGGVTGVPGMNAAREIARDLGRRAG